MKKELDDKLVQDYPKIFANRHGNMRSTAMCWGFECGDGWYWLINSLCSNLQWNTDHNNTDYVIKNKFIRKILPILNKLVQKIPGQYNLERKKQINPLVIIRSYLSGLIFELRKKQKWIYIESNRYPQITAVQVKEKFGGLRFYVETASNEQYAVISWAESLSYKICERCGSTIEVTQTEGWVYTECKECKIKRENT